VHSTAFAPAVALRRWYALAMLTAVYISNIADRFVISTLIEPIKAELHLSDTSIGFLTGTVLGIFYTVMGIPLGLIADRVDRRKLIAISLALWSLMTAACGAANNFLQLALARIGVGVGEAGGTPASQSMLSDLFPFSQRVLATSIFTLGAAAGSMLGSSVGGSVAEVFGWRAAFFALAVPGVALAIAMRFTVQEPARGAMDTVRADSASFVETLKFIRTQPSLLHSLAAATVVTYWGWGLMWWTPAFLMRVHGMTTGQAGTLFGTINGVGGSLGIIASALVIHRLGRSDPRWQVWVVGIATLLGTLASIGVFTANSTELTTLMLWLFIPVAYLNLPVIFNLTQSLALPRMRGLSCALMLFGANIANLALAPQLTGIVSDALLTHLGNNAESLRAALVLNTLTGFWAVYHFWAAGRTLRPDLERAGVRL
jgi:predicted MFS family arabinose efflux permease